MNVHFTISRRKVSDCRPSPGDLSGNPKNLGDIFATFPKIMVNADQYGRSIGEINDHRTSLYKGKMDSTSITHGYCLSNLEGLSSGIKLRKCVQSLQAFQSFCMIGIRVIQCLNHLGFQIILQIGIPCRLCEVIFECGFFILLATC